MSVTTGRSSIDASGDVFVYVPPNAGVVNRGFSVVNGNYNQTPAGNQVTLSGVNQFANGSGQLQATGTVIYRVVTITPGPVLATGGQPAPAPQTTGTIGITAAPSAYVYVPPNATLVAVGSQVSYGPSLTLQDLDVLPSTGLMIIDVQAGSAPLQAMNLALIRTVTLTPL